jgi:hypothetical protein
MPTTYPAPPGRRWCETGMSTLSFAGGTIGGAVELYSPTVSPTTLENWAADHRGQAQHLTEAADASDQMRSLFHGLLQGQAGDALQTSLHNKARLWLQDAAEHQSAATALTSAADYLRGLEAELTGIINHYECQYQTALKQDPAAAEAIVHEAQSEAAAANKHAAIRISAALNGKFGTAPPGYSTNPPTMPNQQTPGIVLTSYQQGGNGSRGVTSAGGAQRQGSDPGVGGANPGLVQASFDGTNPHATSTTGTGQPAANGVYGQPDREQAQTQPVTQPSPVLTPMPGAVSSGASPSVSSGTVGSGSGSGLGQGLASASTTPAESSAPEAADASSGVATAGGGGPGSGVVSGIGTSGALPSAVVSPQVLGGQAQPAAAGLEPAHGIADATVGAPAPNLAPPSTGAVSGSDGAGSAVSAGAAGGGAMLAPSAPGPVAPYSPPGAGSLSSTPPASIPSASLGSPPAGSAAGGVAPLIAGSGAADGSAGRPTERVNPDLATAQQVLAGLVKACPARPIFWAVSVLRTPVGPQTLIAGSVGGGAYLPPEVCVPSTVRLAVLDPALPSGWAAAWMGWQSPLAILVDHYERVTKVVAGVTVSAMITTELWPSRPECGGDFSAVRHEELVMSTAAPLVGGHRLTATDPALAARLAVLDRGGDVTNFVAAQLTRAVWTAAATPDDTGLPMAVKEDADILALVAEGAARREHWDNYRREVELRADGAVMMPEIHAPCDADDSPGSVTARMWYRHYYARGRIAEMVTCWASQPVSLLDVAYCGAAAGFGAVISAVVTEVEKRLAELAGPAGGTR